MQCKVKSLKSRIEQYLQLISYPGQENIADVRIRIAAATLPA